MESIVKEIFHLRGGSECDTTVMYMYSRLFIFPRSSSSPSTNNEKVIVIVVDSQSLIDHKTTMALTASIFGLAALLISY